MMECLACRSKLIEGFLHIQHKFLVCRACFYQFLIHYNNNAFNRISLLNGQIPSRVKKLHAKFLHFVDSQKIETENIFNFKFVDLYDIYINQKYQSQELSTEYSCAESDQFYVEEKNKFDLYDKYSWIKEKLEQNYASVRGSRLGEKVASNIIPARQRIMQKSNIIMNGVSYLKKQLKSLKAESPSLQQIRSFDLGGLLRSKYKSFF